MKILGEGFRKATLQTEYEKAPREFPQVSFWMQKFEAKFPVDFETFDVKMEFAFVINEARPNSLFNMIFYIFFYPTRDLMSLLIKVTDINLEALDLRNERRKLLEAPGRSGVKVSVVLGPVEAGRQHPWGFPTLKIKGSKALRYCPKKTIFDNF